MYAAAGNRIIDIALAGWDTLAKREAAMTLQAETYSVTAICSVLGLARSSFY